MFSANSSQVSEDRLYVEDVFSTWLYTGNGSNQVINNGIDFSTKGGLLWIKKRSAIGNNFLYDTTSGAGASEYYPLYSNTTAARQSAYQDFWNFRTNGFELDGSNANYVNTNNATYASWSFRKAPKFFDVVTYTGDGSARQILSHSLGAEPGCIIFKKTNDAQNWYVWHRSGGWTARNYLFLNTTDPVQFNASIFDSTPPNSTGFRVGAELNSSGSTYVAYLFAHDTTSDGIIQCGTFTAGTEVNLGWEPQWVMIKSRDTADTGWIIIDNMRTWANNGTANGDTEPLEANSSGAEYGTNLGWPTATGFITKNLGTLDCIYIAIRRGPMRTPTSGTTVFSPVTYSGDSAAKTVTSGFPVDLFISGIRPGSSANATEIDRLRGGSQQLITSSTGSEGSYSGPSFARMTGVYLPNNYINDLGNRVAWMFRRAPSFFDEVCYTGDNVSGRTLTHNLKAIPELMIIKRRSASSNWIVYSASIAADRFLQFDLSDPSYFGGNSYWNNTRPTSTVFTLGNDSWVNGGESTFVAYLFASCPGVSKVGSYTGTGTTQTINCGFAAGARFVMIKRTDADGNWYVWDTARGIVSGNDPYLVINSTAAEVTNTDYIDTNSSGFEISSTAPAAINANGGAFIYLAVA